MPDPEDADDRGYAHLIRAVVAIALTVALPFVLYAGSSGVTAVLGTYVDALAAVVAFYFGASSKPG